MHYFQHSVFETGLSDFPLVTVTQFKMGCQKLKPQVITAIIKILINVKFQVDIKTCLSDENDINSFSFDDKKLA